MLARSHQQTEVISKSGGNQVTNAAMAIHIGDLYTLLMSYIDHAYRIGHFHIGFSCLSTLMTFPQCWHVIDLDFMSAVTADLELGSDNTHACLPVTLATSHVHAHTYGGQVQALIQGPKTFRNQKVQANPPSSFLHYQGPIGSVNIAEKQV